MTPCKHEPYCDVISHLTCEIWAYYDALQHFFKYRDVRIGALSTNACVLFIATAYRAGNVQLSTGALATEPPDSGAYRVWDILWA